MIDIENKRLFEGDDLLLLNGKAVSNQDPIVDLAEKMIKLDLFMMGFNRLMVDELMKNEAIEDTN